MKTRSLATELCDGGHVRVNGNAAKPSTKVHAGDRVRGEGRPSKRLRRELERMRRVGGG